jgi:hypothetical protein
MCCFRGLSVLFFGKNIFLSRVEAGVMRRIALLAVSVVLLFMLGACANRAKVDSQAELSAPLPEISANEDSRALVTVRHKAGLQTELQNMIATYLQSERGINPAYSPSEADFTVDVNVLSLALVGRRSEGGGASGREMLQGGLMGAGLGLAVGGLANGSKGALWGAALGAGAGAGAMALTADDSGDTISQWQMVAEVRLFTREQSLNSVRPVRISVYSEGQGLDEATAQPQLEDKLTMEIVQAVR